MYLPCNVPVEVLGTMNQRIVFGRVKSACVERVQAFAPIVESERAGDGDGDCNGGNGDGDNAESSGNVDLRQVEGAQLSTGSQRVRLHQKSQENSPVSSRPPIQSESCPYGLARCRWRCGRLKIERINVSQAQQRETTYLERPHTMQPPGNCPNRAYGVVRPRHRCGRIKITPRNVSRTRAVEKTHLGHVNAIQSTWRPEKKIREVDKLTFEYKMPGEPR